MENKTTEQKQFIKARLQYVNLRLKRHHEPPDLLDSDNFFLARVSKSESLNKNDFKSQLFLIHIQQANLSVKAAITILLGLGGNIKK